MAATTPNAGQAGAVTPEQKRLATMRAKAAFHNIVIHDLANGGYLVCRWNLTKEVRDLDGLSAHLHTMGVR